MSGRVGPGRRNTVRVLSPLLDRLIDENPDQERDPPTSAADTMALLRRSVRRDLESLLNARRRWRSWQRTLTELSTSPVGYGIPDFGSGAFNDPRRREEMRLEIEDTIRRFEPRFLSVKVQLIDERERLDTTLHLRIEAMLQADPAPEVVTFDTVVDPTTDDVLVRTKD
jgi:type VI secretion system protein ImpF